MRSLFLAAALLACGTIGAGAAAKVSVKTTSYGVSGGTGLALIQAMDRKGPKHGFTTRAIAQTGYSVGWEFGWARGDGTCRLVAANGLLDMTYIYPKASGAMPADLKRRWDRFLLGVRKHEETHGAIARAMVAAAEKSVKGLRTARDPNCLKAQAEAKRRVAAVYADYEARQIAFDKREHRDGGNVEGLLRALMKGDRGRH